MLNPTQLSRLRASLIVSAALATLGACNWHVPTAEERLVAQDDARARVLWNNCTSCHGVDGSGDKDIGAPAIGGLPRWYVEAQLHKFRTAQRGFHFDDLMGLKMRPMSLSLPHEEDVALVASYVSKLGTARQGRTLNGSAQRGQAYLATCAACHGQLAEGNKALRAPPLAKQDDWYMLEQLKKFKAGVRGTNPSDASGATMRPMAATLPTEQAMMDVIAAIQALEE